MKKVPKDSPKGWTRQQFIDYLRGTLIPDLRESGRDFTADDYETACKFMEDPLLYFIEDSN